MLSLSSICQPTGSTTADAIEAILRAAPPDEMDIAAAYITGSGLRVLLNAIESGMGDNDTLVQRRWLTSFDYCRTEPVALETIMSLPNSSVKIFDAPFCLSRQCTPRVPFHPKTFFFRNEEKDFVLAGSGNVSRSGLSKGYEAGLSLGIQRNNTSVEPSAITSVNSMRDWFASTWNEATELDEALLAQYTTIFEGVENTKAPTPTEDDVASSYTTRGSLKRSDILKLRVCRNFWIESGNITKNRGPHLAGNQLMMKRLSRVFFGFPPTSVPENSAIGSISVSYDGGVNNVYSLTYSDNGMDKLVLPIPGQEGPLKYDGACLLFRNTSPGHFELSLGSDADKKQWAKKSKQVEGAFAMTSGRKWGVF